MKIVQVTHGRVNPDGDNGITRTVYNINKYLPKVISREIFSFSDTSSSVETYIRDCGTEIRLLPRVKFSLQSDTKENLHFNKGSIFHFHLMWMLDKNPLAKEVRKTKSPYIITTHAAYTPDRINSLKKKLSLKTNEWKYLSNATAIHALCYEEKFMLREMGLKNDIYVIPNGISDKEFIKIKEAKLLDSPYDNDFFNIVWVGRIRPDKNILGMIKAISLLPKDIQHNVRLNLVGDGDKSYVSKVKSLIATLNLESSIIFHGSKFDIEKYNYIDSANLYLQPSFSEGVSFSILDALATGVPTILSRQCNMNYYIKHQAFEVVEPFPEDIASKIISLIENPKKLESLTQNALLLVQKELTWEKLIPKYENMYKSVSHA